MSVYHNIKLVKFAPKGYASFHDMIRAKTNEYFTQNNIDKLANTTMYVKSVVLISMYFVPFIFIVTGLVSFNLWLFYGMWLLMGLGVAGIGMSVMHDSNHGSYFKNQKLNMALGGILNWVGGYARNWRIQHNILHHTYTNLHGLDEDIDAGMLIRMGPGQKLRKFHRYQHIYAWFLYTLMNLSWVFMKDYVRLLRYAKNGMLVKEKVTLRYALIELTAYKLFYLAYTIVLPILVLDIPAYHVLLGFLVMHMLAGLILACVFQMAHVMETSEYPTPPEDLRMENNWSVHQLLNTTNFSPGSRIMSWYVGGLNYQIEHHLFPNISHVHYPKISKLVKESAEHFNLPYNVQPTFLAALIEHGKMLKKLGRNESL